MDEPDRQSRRPSSGCTLRPECDRPSLLGGNHADGGDSIRHIDEVDRRWRAYVCPLVEGHLRSHMKGEPMSTWEPEETPRSEANSIPEPPFATVWRGYDPSQVSEYLRTVAGRVQVLENRAWELESELEQARKQGDMSPLPTEPPDPYETVSGRVADVVRAFDQDVERMRREAEAEVQRILDEARAEAERGARDVEKVRQEGMAEAEGMLVDARAEADRIRVDAQANAEEMRAEAERALKDAQVQADAVLSELQSRRESLVAKLRTLHDQMLDSARGLEPIVEAGEAPDEVVVPEDAVVVP